MTTDQRGEPGLIVVTTTLALLSACPHDPPIVETTASTTDVVALTTSGLLTEPTTGATTSAATCDQPVCVDGAAIPCADGVPGQPIVCDGLCLDGLGCVDCETGQTRCSDLGFELCSDGAWALQAACNPAQGFTCDPVAGACTGPCDPDGLANAGHFGCEFYAASVASLIQGDQVFGIFVTNPGDEPATLTADRPLWVGSTVTIPPHDTAEIYLPWTQHLLTSTDTTLVAAAAVRLQSDRPVAIVQHSPINPFNSAESSLLLPVRVWGDAYRVASSTSRFDFAGLYAVIAAADHTTVELDPRGDVVVVPGDGVGSDGRGTILLDRGDILQVLAAPGSDLTGTGITADGPIAVIGGHACGDMPSGVLGCDHSEESMPPIAQLGRRHAIVPPLRYGGAGRRDQVVRIIAAADLTSLDYDPPQDLPPMLVYAGDHIDVPPGDRAFVVDASAPVMIAQYMLGLEWDGDQGAPSLTIATPVERFRDVHTISVSPYWPLTDVDVVAPAHAAVTVDGELLTDWTPIGSSDLAFAHVRLVPLGGATHTIAADTPIGASVYGQLPYPPTSASHWHPAGHSYAATR